MHLVDLVVPDFYFDLVPPFYFIKWNRHFSASKNLPSSSCHFEKHKSVLLQILYQSSVPSNITLLYIFSSNIIYFGQKEPIKVQFLETFKCSGQNSSNCAVNLWNNKSILLQIFRHSSLSWHITPLSSVNFKLIIFLLWIKTSYQSPNFRYSIALVKICYTLHIIFQTKNYILCTKETNQSKNLENFKHSDQNSQNSSHFWNKKSVFSSNFA